MYDKVDFLLNGQAYGDVATRLMASGMDPGALRPFIDEDGRSYITLNRSGKAENFVTNTPATLQKDEWIQLDRTILEIQRAELQIWADIVGSGLTVDIPNGMGTTVLQHQTMTDAMSAGLTMTGLSQTNRDRPHFDLVNIPLPIVHSDFDFPLREIETSRRFGTPLDMEGAKQSTRRCLELIEQLTIGTLPTYTYGGGTIYGMTNFPNRLTSTITLPTAAGWTPATFNTEILAAVQSMRNIFYRGPYVLYASPGWAEYLDADYSAAYAGETLRTRVLKNPKIRSIRELDYLTNYQCALLQMTSNVVRAIQGMRLQTLQWATHGGLMLNFKVMGIMVPQFRSDSNDDTGIHHMTAA